MRACDVFDYLPNHCSSSFIGPHSRRQFPFSADQVRILVFKECDIRGRKLLFDSSTVEKVSSDSNSAAAAAAFASDHHPPSVPQVQKCEHCNVVYRVRKVSVSPPEQASSSF